ncbi:hypothetical protein [Sphingomonas solaris]|uniref:Uncharacterized protein n=1 Tax=Alterirhizorhabdus solaris TaxID=2529389 RepID=A0A558R966_9SPHN|nr:hypothetical protein [Sphingomonas solaris]TVV75930.1 hypothetical protein FOY91_05640 [Sphingomonas solaris]
MSFVVVTVNNRVVSAKIGKPGGPDMIGRDCGSTVGLGVLPPAAAMSNTPVEAGLGARIVVWVIRGQRWSLVTSVALDTPTEKSSALISWITPVAYRQSIVTERPRRRRRRGTERIAVR